MHMHPRCVVVRCQEETGADQAAAAARVAVVAPSEEHPLAVVMHTLNILILNLTSQSSQARAGSQVAARERKKCLMSSGLKVFTDCSVQKHFTDIEGAAH